MSKDMLTFEEPTKTRLSEGFVKNPRSRLASRESERGSRADYKSIVIYTATISRGESSILRNEAYSLYAAVTKDEA